MKSINIKIKVVLFLIAIIILSFGGYYLGVFLGAKPLIFGSMYDISHNIIQPFNYIQTALVGDTVIIIISLLLYISIKEIFFKED